AQPAAGAGGVRVERAHRGVNQVLRAGELADLRAGLLADAAGGGEVLLLEDLAELRALDDLELAGGGQLVGEHSGEVASGVRVPPARRRLVGEFGDADRRFVGGGTERHRGADKGYCKEKNLSCAHSSP